MEKNTYIGYYRVSTEEQGESGLGLKAQRDSVRAFVKNNGDLIFEYQDVESGVKNNRSGLDAAIKACKDTGATLIVKDLSRISRGGFRIMVDLQESGINFIEASAPNDTQMVKEIKFSLAKDEREKISERTKSALNVIKEKIDSGEGHVSKSGNIVKSLGKPENLTDKDRKKGAEIRSQMAKSSPENLRAYALIKALLKNGDSFYQITKELNEFGFRTSRGKEFSQVQVKRVYEMFNN